MLLFVPLAAATFWLSSCTAALGPGYSIDAQEIHVRCEPAPEPRIHLESVYQLRNTGNQSLSTLEVRLPSRLSFQVENARITWDGSALSGEVSPENRRNTLLPLPSPWKVSERHTLHLDSEIRTVAEDDTRFSFAADAFFLPSQGWAPELLPARGFIASGGVPPKQWRLYVQVPEGFLLHTSGRAGKISRSADRVSLQSLQTPQDPYPFVVAGKYQETSVNVGHERVNLWSRAKTDPAALRSSVDSLSRVLQAYDQTFGDRVKASQPLWIVECPAIPGCFVSERSAYAELLGADPGTASSELASADTLMINFSGGPPTLAIAAPALAASWLGYGQNPGFYDQQPPLSAFPAFASSLGREAVLGPSARADSIQRALQVIPKTAPPRQVESGPILRAKSFLFFYGLEDRYGADVFHRAIAHMLSARRGGGFDLDDLIAAFEQESHQNVAEFVRRWMKHPGVPDDFRARYESASSALVTHTKENMP